ncbi:MAG: hypothetical protein WC503_04065 [Candidatus Shapirobacteria bacterium]
MTDTELLDWLEGITHEGYCLAILFDDNGHWAVVFNGWQNVPEQDEPCDITTSFYVEADKWYPTLREAILAAMTEVRRDKICNMYEEGEND